MIQCQRLISDPLTMSERVDQRCTVARVIFVCQEDRNSSICCLCQAVDSQNSTWQYPLLAKDVYSEARTRRDRISKSFGNFILKYGESQNDENVVRCSAALGSCRTRLNPGYRNCTIRSTQDTELKLSVLGVQWTM